MRTNIVIDDDIMRAAMRGSEFKTKREAVEAGLKLLARQQHNREVLKWEGKLQWNDSPAPGLSAGAGQHRAVMEPSAEYVVTPPGNPAAQRSRSGAVRKTAKTPKASKTSKISQT